MPLDPTLEELSQSPQGAPPSPQGWSPSDTASMTHQPEQPNPAQPYLDRARQFVQGAPEQRGLAGQFSDFLPEWANKNPIADVYRNPEFEEASSLGILKLGPSAQYGSLGKDFKVLNESGNHVADFKVSFSTPDRTEMNVAWLGSRVGPLYGTAASYHSLGLAEIRTLLPEIEREYPNVRRITAYRAGGARHSEARSGEHSNYVALQKDANGKWRIETPKKRQSVPAPPPPYRIEPQYQQQQQLQARPPLTSQPRWGLTDADLEEMINSIFRGLGGQ